MPAPLRVRRLDIGAPARHLAARAYEEARLLAVPSRRSLNMMV
ncbi:MAG: hypothetical protein AB7P23_12140 [Amphiplicatus sp.]